MSIFSKKPHGNRIDMATLPRHIAIIMDGNGRWAKKRGLPRSAGHREGSIALKKIARYANEIGIEFLTVYAFSTENWKRPKEEVQYILNLLNKYLDDLEDDEEEKSQNIKIHFVGDMESLSPEIIAKIRHIEDSSKHKTGMTLNIAFNYGGRNEIISAVNAISSKVKDGQLNEDITEEIFESFLYTADCPDPDIILRPSGEERLSNFLLWQAAYSEFIFMNVLWPDFKEKHLLEVISEFQSRNRRYGGI